MKKIAILFAFLIFAADISASAAAEEKVTAVKSGAARDEIHSIIGKPNSTSSGNYKDTYLLDNGNTAVLTYRDDTFDSGFIIIN